MYNLFLPASCFLCILNGVFASYSIELSSDSPVVQGATVHFKAKLLDDGEPASGSFRYEWRDNSVENHHATHDSESPVDRYNVTYDRQDNPLGFYTMQLTVLRNYVIFYKPIGSERLYFQLTETLNGKLDLIQSKNVHRTKYVSNAEPLVNLVTLHPADADYLKNATSLLSYWFVDCIYYGLTDTFNFTLNFTDVNKSHRIETLVVAGFEPLPPPTTTAAPTTTTTTKSPPTTTTTAKPKTDRIKRNVQVLPATFDGKTWQFPSRLPSKGEFPYICQNDSIVAPDPNKTYGYFVRDFATRAPISNLSVTGNYWLQQGELLNLNVRCAGSSQFNYCKHIYQGFYNVTGNETCTVPPSEALDKCEFIIQHLFTESTKYTIVIVLYNDVSKLVQPVTVTIYHVTKQAQLSVIVIPVVFTLSAIVLIIFGIAYYVQNRNRFIVEVANFNFGQQYNDMEYKSFRERLRDSFVNAFTRPPTPSSSEPTIWPPGRKYGSLT